MSGCYCGEIPSSFLTLHREVFGINGEVHSTCLPASVKALRQLSLFFSKMQVKTVKSDLELWEEFCTRQEKLLTLRIEHDHPVVVIAKRWLDHHLGSLDLCDIIPRNGPGAVAESMDQERRYAFPSWYSPAQRAYPWEQFGTSQLESLSNPGSPGAATTRVVIVPKDYRGGRLISVEPASQQFLQQGQMMSMYRYLLRKPFSHYIRLQNQEYNRELARSYDHSTIDLSNASDMVSATLVWYLWPARSRAYLFRTRTPFARFGDHVQRISAFAPMGASVCFPVLTTVLCALVVGVWKMMFPKDPLHLVGARVYGDDIVCPNVMSQPLLGTLSSLGMLPNMSKTCLEGSRFRESCGAEYFDGEDITIFRPRWFPSSERSLGSLQQWIILNQQAYAHRLWLSHAYTADRAREIGPVPAAVGEARDGFLSDWQTDISGCRTRWNRDLHRLEVRTVISAKKSRHWIEGAPNRLLARLIGDSSDRVPARCIKYRTGWRSVPE